MHKRIREIRKSQISKEEQTQKAFAAKLNISRSQLSYYESGTVTIPERSVKDICDKFNINEEWLRNGVGQKEKELTEQDELAYMIGVLFSENNAFKIKIIKAMLSLDDEDWYIIEKLINKFMK